jgi:hypothetical protein
MFDEPRRVELVERKAFGDQGLLDLLDSPVCNIHGIDRFKHDVLTRLAVAAIEQFTRCGEADDRRDLMIVHNFGDDGDSALSVLLRRDRHDH